MKVSIGDVLVFPADDAPTYGGGLCGQTRSDALNAFRQGHDTRAFRFYWWPYGRSCVEVTDPTLVEWGPDAYWNRWSRREAREYEATLAEQRRLLHDLVDDD